MSENIKEVNVKEISKGPGKKLPYSGLTYETKSMTGHDEDILTNERKLKQGTAIEEVMTNCTVELGGEKPSKVAILNLTTYDRTSLLLDIRKQSFGDILENVEITCPYCKELNLVDIDLNTLNYTERPKDMQDTREIEIFDTKVVLKHMTGVEEQKISSNNKKDGLLTEGMFHRIEEVVGVHPNGIKRWLKDLPINERRKIRDEIDQMECGYDTMVKFDCIECEREITRPVQGITNFLYPGM